MKKKFWLFIFIAGFTILALFFLLRKKQPPAANYLNQKAIDKKIENKKTMLKITSPAFENQGFIPQKYTCDGENINPPLKINNLPSQAKSLVLIVDDPDAPMATWNHWLVWNIPPETKEIKENSFPQGAVLGKNDFGKLEYGGPCPPSGTHRYFFHLYALDTILQLSKGTNRNELEQAMKNHIMGQGELMGKYQR